jgi:hypothetical protein
MNVDRIAPAMRRAAFTVRRPWRAPPPWGMSCAFRVLIGGNPD